MACFPSPGNWVSVLLALQSSLLSGLWVRRGRPRQANQAPFKQTLVLGGKGNSGP